MQVLDDIEKHRRAPRRPDVLFNLALSSVLMGGAMGGFMAWFNAWASPYYFQLLMGWTKEEVLMGNLIKGITGGMVYGFAFAAFFIIVCGWATRFSCSFSFAFRQLIKASAFVLLGWALGGFMESASYWMEPNRSLPGIFALPFDASTSPEYWEPFWVHGSIIGQKAGFCISIALSPLIVWQAWRKGRRVNVRTSER